MEQGTCTKEFAEATNYFFERVMYKFLRAWARDHEHETLLKFDRPLHEYLVNDALRDFFLNTRYPVQKLLKNNLIACHLGRRAESVYFDPVSGDPLFALTEQRIYNLARRMDGERMHIPFRSVHPNKQTEAGDTADINTYPVQSETLRYNSGNHFSSRPANGNVFDENSRCCMANAEKHLQVLFKRGFLEDRLHDVKAHTASMHEAGETQLQFFLIYSRHSLKEGHFGVSLLIMDPLNPDFPKRVLICDTLLKELPHHPRWWNYFVAEYANVFGNAVAELLEDVSHPLQKINIKGDDPYRHDWDCPYYAASMANALAVLVNTDPGLIINGTAYDIHSAMKGKMQDYYQPGHEIKKRPDIQQINRLKRWNSGRELIKDLVTETRRTTPMYLIEYK